MDAYFLGRQCLYIKLWSIKKYEGHCLQKKSMYCRNKFFFSQLTIKMIIEIDYEK